jgi:hypothetical protein
VIHKPTRAPPPAMTMRRALSDPALLGNVLADDSWRAWRILLVAMMGEALDAEERAIFQSLTGRAAEPLERCDELWAVVGRRGGKSRAIAVLCVFVAAFIDHSAVLVVGEKPIVLCLAQTAKNAGVVFDYIVGILESVPLLAPLISARTQETLALTNGIGIEVRPASFRNVRGVTSVAVVADEAAFWYSDDSGAANPDVAILDAVRPTLATTGGPLIVISSPYAKRGALWDAFRRDYGEAGDPRVLVAQGASRTFNPSLPQKVVDRAMERDPAAATAEYLALFRSDLEAFVSLEVVEACIAPGIFERGPLPGVRYAAFCDPSGGSADSMTLAIVHTEKKGDRKDGARVILDAVREVRPPFSPDAVVEEFEGVLRSYGIRQVRGDRYAGLWPADRFKAHRIEYLPAERPKSDLYRDVLPLLNSCRVELLDLPRLKAQFVSLERRTSRAGKDSIDAAQGRPEDVANAVAGALVLESGNVAGDFLKLFTPEFTARCRQPPGLRFVAPPPHVDDDVIPIGRLSDDGERVLMNCPRAFQLTLDDRRRVRFHAGVNDVPVRSRGHVVAAHEYVIANGARAVNHETTGNER